MANPIELISIDRSCFLSLRAAPPPRRFCNSITVINNVLRKCQWFTRLTESSALNQITFPNRSTLDRWKYSRKGGALLAFLEKSMPGPSKLARRKGTSPIRFGRIEPRLLSFIAYSIWEKLGRVIFYGKANWVGNKSCVIAALYRFSRWSIFIERR